MTHVLAKVFGWTQFVAQTGNQIFSTQPHGWQGWFACCLSLVTAIGIHAASSTDGTK